MCPVEPGLCGLLGVARNKRVLLVLLRQMSSYASPGIHDLLKITQVVAEPELEAISLAPGPLGKGHGMNRLQAKSR